MIVRKSNQYNTLHQESKGFESLMWLKHDHLN